MSNAATILLAEDNDNDALLMRHAFRRAGVSNPVLRVCDGEEAVDYLSGNGVYAVRQQYPLPVLLLLDLKMPRLNGFEVLSWVRSQERFQHLPVTILTSSDHPY